MTPWQQQQIIVNADRLIFHFERAAKRLSERTPLTPESFKRMEKFNAYAAHARTIHNATSERDRMTAIPAAIDLKQALDIEAALVFHVDLSKKFESFAAIARDILLHLTVTPHVWKNHQRSPFHLGNE